VFSHPCSDTVLTSTFNLAPRLAVELGRFVLLDSVPGNGESWFLVRALTLIHARGIHGVVSFSDPQPRRTSTGALILAGHVGTCYQASNAIYMGRATPRTAPLTARRPRPQRRRHPKDSLR